MSRYSLKHRFEFEFWCAQLVRNEPLKITYSYWDGQGHRRVVTIRKGDSIAQFLQKVKEQLHPDFRELRRAASPHPCALCQHRLCSLGWSTLENHGHKAGVNLRQSALHQWLIVSLMARALSCSFALPPELM